MKKLLFVLFIPIIGFSQEAVLSPCDYNSSSSIGAKQVLEMGVENTFEINCGENFTLELIAGNTYFLGTSNSMFDPVMSIYTNTIPEGFNDDNPYENGVESGVYYTPRYTGEHQIQINEYGTCNSDIGESEFHVKLISQPKPLITIPVVVHVIHNGEDYGVGRNITDEQIHDQIRILNDDFRRLNQDVGNSPELFRIYSSGMNIEFMLATHTPDGTPTDGILRYERPYPSFSNEAADEIKLETIWNSLHYLNIWSLDLEGELAGFAQFPTTLANITGLSSDPNTDGVVVDYQFFGISAKNHPNYNLGRTLTHEVGHWLGLLHTFYGGCTTDDGISDTPLQDQHNSGCDDINWLEHSCTKFPTMYTNYMDYSSDACLNMFTHGQQDVMAWCLNNDRYELQFSQGVQSSCTASIIQSGDLLSAVTYPIELAENADWYNIQNIDGVNKYWLMAENSSSFSPKFDCSYFIIVEDENSSCSDTSSIYYFAAKAAEIGDITTSPNPTSGLVNLKFENKKNQFVSLNLFNSSGILLDQFLTKNSELDIDLSAYPSGMYYISFDSSKAKQGCIKEETLQNISKTIILNK